MKKITLFLTMLCIAFMYQVQGQTTHVDFDSNNPDINFSSWNGSSTFEKVLKSSADGSSDATFVGKFISGNDNGIGVGVDNATTVFPTSFNLAALATFKMKVWTDHEVDVTLHLENQPDWGNNMESTVSVTSNQLNQWVELTFDFSSNASNVFMNNIVIKVGGANTTTGSVIYFDDIIGPALYLPQVPLTAFNYDFTTATPFTTYNCDFNDDATNTVTNGINKSSEVGEISDVNRDW